MRRYLLLSNTDKEAHVARRKKQSRKTLAKKKASRPQDPFLELRLLVTAIQKVNGETADYDAEIERFAYFFRSQPYDIRREVAELMRHEFIMAKEHDSSGDQDPTDRIPALTHLSTFSELALYKVVDAPAAHIRQTPSDQMELGASIFVNAMLVAIIVAPDTADFWSHSANMTRHLMLGGPFQT